MQIVNDYDRQEVRPQLTDDFDDDVNLSQIWMRSETECWDRLSTEAVAVTVREVVDAAAAADDRIVDVGPTYRLGEMRIYNLE